MKTKEDHRVGTVDIIICGVKIEKRRALCAETLRNQYHSKKNIDSFTLSLILFCMHVCYCRYHSAATTYSHDSAYPM